MVALVWREATRNAGVRNSGTVCLSSVATRGPNRCHRALAMVVCSLAVAVRWRFGRTDVANCCDGGEFLHYTS